MSHIEGDGVIEDIYYLLWRKDSPFNERLNIQIPETVIFRKGRPIAWYFTNSEGVVLRKKQTSLLYEEILTKFTKKVNEGDIVAYFININEEKKLEQLLDKTYFEGPSKAEHKDNEEVPPCHDVEYFGLKEFKHTFSDYKNFENKTGILQKFIHPYGSNNELIQAIWSPRVCVFTKRVNLRRLNETRFDIYERALTFDGPDFYSKNVPLRGGYIPGKLRATCDNIVQHIAYISYEKISIKRLVGYFKVDKDENVWFLWTSSIRINETSKVHKRLSNFVDKPLCLEPCMQTSMNIRHIKTNFASRPVTLQMNEECTVCAKRVSKIALIPIIYRLLLGNEEILKRSEHSASQARLLRTKNNFDFDESKPKTIRKASIGVPYFIKKLHPNMKLKEFQTLRDQEHFLQMKADVCEECYLIVSKEYEGGFPYNLTEAKKVSLLNDSDTSARNEFSRGPGTVGTTDRFTNSGKKNQQTIDDDDSNCEEDTIRENSPKNRGDVSAADFISLEASNTTKAPPLKGTKAKLFNLLPKPIYPADEIMDVSKTTTSNKSTSFPRFMNRTVWAQTTKNFNNPSRLTGDSYTEETKFDSFHVDHSHLKRDVVKALMGDSETSSRNLYSANRSQHNATALARITSGQVPQKQRPQTSQAKQNAPKQGRKLRVPQNEEQVPYKYQLEAVPDLFDDSNQESEELENLMDRKITEKDEQNQKLRKGKGTSKVEDLKALVAANSVKHGGLKTRTTESGENKARGYLVDLNQELNTENQLQDHLDQDIVLMMENDEHKKNEKVLLLNNYQLSRKDNTSAASSSYSFRMDTQGSTNNPHPPSKLGFSTLRTMSGNSTKLKFKQPNAFSEKTIVKELEDRIEDIIGRYSGDGEL